VGGGTFGRSMPRLEPSPWDSFKQRAWAGIRLGLASCCNHLVAVEGHQQQPHDVAEGPAQTDGGGGARCSQACHTKAFRRQLVLLLVLLLHPCPWWPCLCPASAIGMYTIRRRSAPADQRRGVRAAAGPSLPCAHLV
jgi:hypothetical protein